MGFKGDWPLIGRQAELAQFARLVAGNDRGGVVLAGPAGVGKTRLAVECLHMAEAAGYATARAAGSPGVASLPLGALAPLLPSFDAPGLAPAEMLWRVGTSLADRGEGRRLALLVDDAHLIDDTSATLLSQFAASRRVFVIATVRAGYPAPEAVVALWKEDVAERVDVSPLNATAVSDLLTRVLEGPVDGAALHWLFTHSEGNPLYLRELVLGALDADALRKEDGLWRLRGTPVSNRLIELIELRLRALTEAEREVLEFLAYAEPLGIAVLEDSAGPDVLSSLERHDLLAVSADGRRLEARLAHPLYADVLRARIPPLLRRGIHRRLADALEATGARRREDVLRVATCRLEGGGHSRPELILAAATAARNRWALPLAERLAQTAAESGAGFEADLLLGQLYSLQGRSREAEEVLSAMVPKAADDSQRAMLAGARMDLFVVGLDQLDKAIRIGEEAEATIAEVASRDEVIAKRAQLLVQAGHRTVALELVDALVERAEGRTLVSAAMTRAVCLLFTGKFSAAIETTRLGRSAHLALTGPPPILGADAHVALQSLALYHGGRLREAEELLTGEYRRAVADGSLETQVAASHWLSRVLLTRGQVGTAARMAGEAAGVYRELHHPTFLRLALTVLAHARAMAGSPDQARTALAELDTMGKPPSDPWGAELLQAQAWTEIASGDLASAFRLLEEAVAMSLQRQELIHEAAALHDLARLGRARDVAGRLAELAVPIEGPLAAARAAHAAALADGDAVRLESASEAFEAIGADLLAAEAATAAAVAHQRARAPRQAAAWQHRALKLAERCEGASTPPLRAVGVQTLLSRRELEVATLAAGGLSNKEIAARLHVSVRTVENQLQRVYEKIGVDGRTELSHVLTD